MKPMDGAWVSGGKRSVWWGRFSDSKEGFLLRNTEGREVHINNALERNFGEKL
jgi:hypothetical protein